MSDSNSFSLLTKVMNIDMLLCYTDPSAINKVWQTDLMTFMEAILASYTYTYTPHKCTSPHIYTLIHTCTQYINIYTDTCLVVHLCPTLCNPMDCSPPGSSVREIFQAGVFEFLWSTNSLQPPRGIQTQESHGNYRMWWWEKEAKSWVC